MRRISSYMPSDNMQYHMREREFRMNELSEKMASQERIKELRDDPLGAGRATRFDSRVTRMRRFDQNIGIVRGTLAVTEGYMREGVDILQRLNELAVQGANGIYDRKQMAVMAEEVDQLLRELVQIGNAKSEEGNGIFSGLKIRSDAFRPRLGPVEGSGVERIAAVDYIGNVGVLQAEVDEGSFMPVNMPGNHAFWAEDQQIYGTQDATAYRVQERSAIRIDGVSIELQAGDNVASMIGKINDSAAPVRARLDPVQNSLVLESTRPHQIWLEDLSGTVFQDLGMIAEGDSSPPGNLALTTRQFGGSIFDMVIHLRDSLFAGDAEAVGGSGLRGIQQSIESLTGWLADLGARDARMQIVSGRLNYEIPEVEGLYSREVDLDLSRAITDLKMLEYTHKAAVNTTARILRPTLLDFLR